MIKDFFIPKNRKIRLVDLKAADIGIYVMYHPWLEAKIGRIKDWNESGIFIVYGKKEKLERYKDFTAAHTKEEDVMWLVPRS